MRRRVVVGAVAIAVLGVSLYFLWGREAPAESPVGESAQGTVGSKPVEPGAAATAEEVVDSPDASVDGGTIPATLAGEVIEAGAAVAGADVTAKLRDEEPPSDCATHANARTVAGGGFDFGELCPGLYDVIAVRGSMVSTAVLRLTAGTAERLVLELAGRARLIVTVQTAPKAPIAGAKVTAKDKATGFVATAITDATGVATIEPLLAHIHEVWVEVDDGLPSYVPDTPLRVGDTAITVTVKRGAFVTGQVLQPNGVPAEGLTVGLLRTGKRGARGDRAARSESSDGGQFRIGPVEPGNYLAITYDGRWLPANERAVAPGPPVNIHLKSGPSLIGEVLEADGTLVSTACSVDAYAPHFDVEVKCDAGTFYFPSVRAGPIGLAAAVPRLDGGAMSIAFATVDVPNGPGPVYATIQFEDHEGTISGRCTQEGRGAIAISESTFRQVQWTRDRRDLAGGVKFVQCTPEFTISGLKPGKYVVGCDSDMESSVTVETGATGVVAVCKKLGKMRYRVVDEAGRPIERFGTSPGRYRDYPDGVYSTDDAEPGEYSLSIYSPGYLPAQRKLVVPEGGMGDLGDILLSRSGTVLTGRVTDATDNAPVANAALSLWVPLANSVQAAHTGADGTFTLPDVPRGPQELVVWHADYDGKQVPLTDGQTAIDVKLSRGVSIRGTVVTATGQVPQGLRVRAFCGTKPSDDSADVEDGRYELESLALCPAWKVRVEGQREASLSVFDVVTVAASKPGRYRADFVERSSGVSFQVETVDWRGVPVHAHVFLVDAALPSPRTIELHRAFLSQNALRCDGTSSPYSFDAVKPGQWRLIAFPDRERAAVIEQPLNVAPGMQSTVTLTFPQGLARMPP